MNHNQAYLHLVCGPMFSGKSTELFRLYNRELGTGREIQAFNYQNDKRYNPKGDISSHNSLTIPSLPILYSKDIKNQLNKCTQTVLVDEVQFLDEGIITLTQELIGNGLKVILAGLDRDFRGEPFKFKDSNHHMGYLIAISECLSRLEGICRYTGDSETECGQPATRTQRLIDGKPAHYNDSLVLIGGKENYHPRCFKHHFVPK